MMRPRTSNWPVTVGEGEVHDRLVGGGWDDDDAGVGLGSVPGQGGGGIGVAAVGGQAESFPGVDKIVRHDIDRRDDLDLAGFDEGRQERAAPVRAHAAGANVDDA